ncbi:MAG: hypothetical protein JWM86_256 [Thermoleophilia bacterium]|nr:hypothetical protein [Thermoleophilia bacterium]
MTGISSTGTGLPSAQSLFAGSAPTIAAAPTMATTTTGLAPGVDPNAQQPGFTVQGQGGSTSLPAASPNDFNSVNPTPLDQPHPQYPGLIQSHVAVLQAIGTPPQVLVQLNAERPQAEYLERYIQGEIMQNPEGWDAAVGNPAGTARAGLQKLMPGVQLPAVGAGNPGTMPDGTSATGLNVPGVAITQPNGEQTGISGETVVKGLFWGAVAAGVGFLGWKFLKGRSAAKALEAGAAAGAANLGNVGAAGALAGGGALGAAGAAGAAGAHGGDLLGRLGGLNDMFRTLGGGAAAAGGAEAELTRNVALAAMTGNGTLAEQTSRAASTWGVLKGLAPGEGHAMSVHAAASYSGLSETLVHKMAMESRWMGVMEQLASNGGTLGDAAAAGILSRQALASAGATAATSTVSQEGFRQILMGALQAAT